MWCTNQHRHAQPPLLLLCHNNNTQLPMLPVAGAYDPKLVSGWKADPKSAFVGDERFRTASQEVSEGQ